MLNKGPKRPGFGLGLKPWHYLRPGTLDHGRQVWIALGKNPERLVQRPGTLDHSRQVWIALGKSPERLWIWISTRRGPGFGYWLLDKDGLGFGRRVQTDMDLSKALVIGFGVGHRL